MMRYLGLFMVVVLPAAPVFGQWSDAFVYTDGALVGNTAPDGSVWEPEDVPETAFASFQEKVQAVIALWAASPFSSQTNEAAVVSCSGSNFGIEWSYQSFSLRAVQLRVLSR